MKAVIQRVSSAKVVGKLDRRYFIDVQQEFYLLSVNEELISTIGRGLCILVGIHQNDSISDVNYL